MTDAGQADGAGRPDDGEQDAERERERGGNVVDRLEVLEDAEPLRAGIERLQRACLEADGVAPFNEATMLELGERRAVVAAIEGGGIAGAALARCTADGELEAELAVQPGWRRAGCGAHLWDRLRGLAEGRPLAVWAHGALEPALAMARRREFAPARTLLKLALPFDEAARERALAEASLPAPDGVILAALEHGRDEDELLAINAEAFRDHPEQGALDRAGFEARAREPWFAPERILVARDAESGRMLGFNWLKVDGDEAEIYVIGVADAAAGRGIGRALMRRGLGLLAATGRPAALLYVEGGNERAVGLYRSLGFEDLAVDVQLRADAAAEA